MIDADRWWFHQTWSDFRRGTQRARVSWTGGQATIRLYDEGVAETVRGFAAALPFEAQMVHAAWSGEMIMGSETHDLGVVDPENAVRLVRPGDLTWDPKFGELCVVYGDAECRLPSGENTVVVFARVEDGFDGLAAFCRERRFAGVGSLRFDVLEVER